MSESETSNTSQELTKAELILKEAMKPSTSIEEKAASVEEIEKGLSETRQNLLRIIGEEDRPSIILSSDPLEKALEVNTELQELLTLATEKLAGEK